MVAIGVTWSWLIVLVEPGGRRAPCGGDDRGDLTGTLLMVLTAFGGASAVVAGLMLLFGVISADDFDSEATTQTIPDDWWWYAIYLGLAIAGMIAEYQSTAGCQARCVTRGPSRVVVISRRGDHA